MCACEVAAEGHAGAAAASVAPPIAPTLSCSVEPSKLVIEQAMGSVQPMKVTVSNRGTVSVYISWLCNTRHGRDNAINAPASTPRMSSFYCAIDSVSKAALL